MEGYSGSNGAPGGRRPFGAAVRAAILLALSFAVIRDWLKPHFVFGHSAFIDYVRQLAVDHALRTRGIFPGWVPEFYFGFGSPIFLFYAPLPYVFSGIFSVLGLGPLGGLKLVYALTVLIAGATMYRLARSVMGPWAALAAAALYVAAPYVLINLYQRSAIGELLALAIAPEAFLALVRLEETGDPRHALRGAVAVALLVLAHNISALILFPVLVGYAISRAAVHRDPRTAALAAGSFALGLALSAFFWFPALVEKKFVRSEEGLTTGFFHYANHFAPLPDLLVDRFDAMDPRLGLEAIVRVPLGHLHLLLFAVGIAAALAIRTRARGTVLYFAAMAALGVFFTTPASQFLWDHLPLVRFVQFPWRFFVLVTPAVALVGGSIVAATGAARPRWAVAVALAAVLGAAAYALPRARGLCVLYDARTGDPVPVDRATADDPSRWSPGWVAPGEVLTLDVMPQMGITSTAQDDYLPVWSTAPPHRPLPTFRGRPNFLQRVRGNVEILDRVERGDRFTYPLRGNAPVTLVLHVFYFPGWEATLDGAPLPIRVSPGLGDMTFDVPPGEHLLDVRFVGSPLRRAAKKVSWAALGLTLALGAVGGARRLARKHCAGIGA
jgi:hypothetical protein